MRHQQQLLAMSDSPAVGGGPSGPVLQGYDVPGRNPDSQMPWRFFLGNAAHRLIAYMYGVNHPGSQTYYNTDTIYSIVRDARLGDTSRLLPNERALRPDITDVTALYVFEIKTWHDQSLQEGRQEVRTYLAALNRVAAPDMLFSGGIDFRGEVLIRFARGNHIWRLEWWGTEPGVIQYRWTRSQRRFESEVAAYEDGQWVVLTHEEMQQYGGWVGQAVEEMVSRRERLATFSGAVGIVIEVLGNVATGFFSGAIQGRMGSGPGVKQPPSQGGGQVIPFPARPPPAAPPAQVPAAASGMPLPRR
ncbi:hypothetical protein NR798_35705 [Archangium gephyra]|uniref:hypothetical protein n=1 Tax=Archangium gephyra TaxID=48 RepID=UPI0035D47CD9